jgi:hypothetical protein
MIRFTEKSENGKKEIGAGKILGATVFNFWQLLSKDFIIMVLISFLIGLFSLIILCTAGYSIFLIIHTYHGGFSRQQV